MNNPHTLEDLEVWISELERDRKLIKIIVGNKSDLHETPWRVSTKQGNNFAERIKAFYYEIRYNIAACLLSVL